MGDELRRAEEFAAELVDAYGAEIRSIVLYGSAAREQFHEGTSDLNILVLLEHVDASTVRRGSVISRRWVEQGNPPPLLLSDGELQRSLDVFAIEYSDIRDAHRVLHGDDPFAALEIEPEHLRLQCERELKSALIRLRERYLLSASEPEELGSLLRRSISTFLVLFRTVLRLSGEEVPAEHEGVIRAAAARVGFAPGIWLEILRARRDGAPLHPDAEDPLVTSYLEAVARTLEYVDGLPVHSSSRHPAEERRGGGAEERG